MAKRIVSAIIASLCAFSMLTSVVSAEINTAGGESKLTAIGKVNTPIIHVKVPTATGFIANPYKMKVKVNGKSDPVDSLIIGTPFEFVSESNIALDVYVSATNTKYGNVKLLKAPPASTDKHNSMFIYLKGAPGTVPVESNASDAAGQDGIVVMTDNVKQTYMLTIESAEDEHGGIIEGGKKANFNIFGTVNENAFTPWTRSDKVDINLVFKFEIAKNR